ncbi:hypothetical protein HJG60_009104 [Phyllostomus discolor]|uniref:Uncharacterized protein n=1 Tax=Phyllostomus discolor TaxID=89673 RepID=A0A833YS95_9CHIR|nr:hypothetical protein HJG60_009104 [Phyllostomus discolor]
MEMSSKLVNSGTERNKPQRTNDVPCSTLSKLARTCCLIRVAESGGNPSGAGKPEAQPGEDSHPPRATRRMTGLESPPTMPDCTSHSSAWKPTAHHATAWKQIYDIQNTAAQTQGPRSNGRRRGFRPVVCCLFEGFVLVHCVIIKHDMETRPWTQTLRV